MKKKRLYKGFALLAAMALGVSLLSGCAGRSTESLREQEDAETIQVYLWTDKLYEKYAPLCAGTAAGCKHCVYRRQQ